MTLANTRWLIYHPWALEIAFERRSLREICESETAAEDRLGKAVADRLKARLADLRAAITVTDLLVGRPHEVEAKPNKHIAINLCGDYSIIIAANHHEVPLFRSGEVAWSKVSRIKVMAINAK